jgi:hypothetical protein
VIGLDTLCNSIIIRGRSSIEQVEYDFDSNRTRNLRFERMSAFCGEISFKGPVLPLQI